MSDKLTAAEIQDLKEKKQSIKEELFDQVKVEMFEASQRLESEEIYELRQKKKKIVEDSIEFRLLKVYFDAPAGSKFKISIDGKPADIKEDYFQFSTPVNLHGSCSVSVRVEKGSVTLKKCIVTYPALVNNQPSQVTLLQPIKSPIALVNCNEIQTLDFPVTVTKELNFQHLMFNGPSRFIIHCNKDCDNLYLGNILEGDPNPNIQKIDTVYDYTPQPNDIFSIADLKQLYTIVLYKTL